MVDEEKSKAKEVLSTIWYKIESNSTLDNIRRELISCSLPKKI